MASPLHKPSSISNSEEAHMQTESASLLQDHTICRPQLSEKLRHTRVLELQSTHPTTRRINWTPDRCITRHQDEAPDDSKIQSRISLKDQTRPVESCSAGPSGCQDHVHAEIATKTRNAKSGSSDQGRSTSVAGADARQELRRFLATLSDRESIIEERLKRLERENAEILLEVWRLKLEFARLTREIRGEVFTAKIERIIADSKL